MIMQLTLPLYSNPTSLREYLSYKISGVFNEGQVTIFYFLFPNCVRHESVVICFWIIIPLVGCKTIKYALKHRPDNFMSRTILTKMAPYKSLYRYGACLAYLGISITAYYPRWPGGGDMAHIRHPTCSLLTMPHNMQIISAAICYINIEAEHIFNVEAIKIWLRGRASLLTKGSPDSLIHFILTTCF